MRIALETLGCKLNQAETETLARTLAEDGHEIVGGDQPADVYVLNTCTVTNTADGKARQLLRRARRRHRSARIIALGCYVDRAKHEVAGIDGVDLVLGNSEKSSLPGLLRRPGETTGGPRTRPMALTGRTRSFVKIQEGCTSRCSYCIVPLVRSRETSLPAAEVAEQVRRRADEGYREIVLTGTKVGAYRDGDTCLAGLLERVLEETAVARLRLSSLQPQEVTAGLIGLWRDDRLCPHFHLSLQSGSDRVLERMRRRYDTAAYVEAVHLIREAVPGAAITTDVMVGFPGETDDEFGESYALCESLGFARIHVFPFSGRGGTEAASLPRQVDTWTVKGRGRGMLALAERAAAAFRQRFSGETMTVLWEQRTTEGTWTGLTGNYIRVFTESDQDLTNRLTAMEMG